MSSQFCCDDVMPPQLETKNNSKEPKRVCVQEMFACPTDLNWCAKWVRRSDWEVILDIGEEMFQKHEESRGIDGEDSKGIWQPPLATEDRAGFSLSLSSLNETGALEADGSFWVDKAERLWSLLCLSTISPQANMLIKQSWVGLNFTLCFLKWPVSYIRYMWGFHSKFTFPHQVQNSNSRVFRGRGEGTFFHT